MGAHTEKFKESVFLPVCVFLQICIILCVGVCVFAIAGPGMSVCVAVCVCVFHGLTAN